LLLAAGACTHLLHLEQLHSEDIWHKVFLPSNKSIKLYGKRHGVVRKKPTILNTLLLLVVAGAELKPRVQEQVVEEVLVGC
jgi:hypothetical protein